MATTTNKYGLSRNIPETIKRQIRQDSGFGCVICGLGIIQYEHVDPPFKKAKEHDPLKMTLLCPRCHNKVTTGMMSKDTVKKAMLNPKCLQRGYSNEFFDAGGDFPDVVFCGLGFHKCNMPVLIKNVPVITILPPMEKNGPFTISAVFYDSKGTPSLVIKDNEWQAYSANWDVKVVGNTLTIMEGTGRVVLRIESELPERLVITHVDMLVNGVRIKGNLDGLGTFDPISNKFLGRISYLGFKFSQDPKYGFIGVNFNGPGASSFMGQKFDIESWRSNFEKSFASQTVNTLCLSHQ